MDPLRRSAFLVFAPPNAEAFIAMTDDPGRWPLRRVSLEDHDHRRVNLLRADGEMEQLDLSESVHAAALVERIRSDEGLMVMAFRAPGDGRAPGIDDLMPEHVAFVGHGLPLEQIHAAPPPEARS